MKTVLVNGNETVACAVLRGETKTDFVALRSAIRMGASRMVVIADAQPLESTLKSFLMTPADVESYPLGTDMPVGNNVLVFDSAQMPTK